MTGSATDSGEAGQMSQERFRAEKLYYISLSIAKSMLEKDVIDQGMLAVINEKLLEKYHPVMGMLLAGRDTACRSAEAGAEV